MTLGAARVIWTINDLSMFIDEIVRGYVLMVIKAERGPIAEPRIISHLEEYRRVFGRKVDYTTDPLVCEMALRLGARLILMRTAHYEDITDPTSITATTSTVTLKDRGATPIAATITGKNGPFWFTPARGGSVLCSELGPYTFGDGTSDKMVIKVGTGEDQTVTLTGSTRNAQQVADQINAATSGLTALEEGGRVRITANTLTDAIEIKTVSNDAYSVLGLLETIYPIEVGTDKLVVSVDGGADQTFTFTGTGVPFELTSSQIASQLHALTGATATTFNGRVRLYTTNKGDDVTLQVKDTSTADPVLGFDHTIYTGGQGTSKDTLKFTSKDPGDWGNHLKVQISDSALDPDGSFNIKVIYSLQGNLTEYFGDVNLDPKSDRYVVNYINERSNLVICEDLYSDNVPPTNRPIINLTGVPLMGGENGLDGFCDRDWIGDPAAQTGMYSIDKAPYMAMDFMIPGTTSVTVYNAMIAYAESRGDLIGYGQVPWGMEPEEVVDWREGNAPWSHPAFNSHRFALFFGRPLVYDDLDDSRKYISCLGHLAACLCKTDNDYGYHYAPVGPRRGAVGLVEGIDKNIQGYRVTGYADLFAEYGINYLMISHFPGIEGAMFWEQRTTQRAASALRELNVMRFITMLNRSLMPVLRTFLFEPNHPMTWRELHRILQPAFQSWKDKYGIYDFALQTDRDAFFDGGVLRNAVINSGLDIDRGIYHVRALIQPTRAIYYLEFELGVMRTGEAFENYISLKQLPGWVKH